MDEPPPDLWSRLRLYATNAFIVLVLAIVAVESLPLFPPRLVDAMRPVACATGLWQGNWAMFAPEPDNTNHRLEAEIEYADGTVVAWHSPDWRSQGAWQRFTENRLLEYIDAIPAPTSAVARHALADYLARTQRPPGVTAKPRRVTIWIEEALIPPPDEAGWPPLDQRVPYDIRSLLHEERYP